MKNIFILILVCFALSTCTKDIQEQPIQPEQISIDAISFVINVQMLDDLNIIIKTGPMAILGSPDVDVTLSALDKLGIEKDQVITFLRDVNDDGISDLVVDFK